MLMLSSGECLDNGSTCLNALSAKRPQFIKTQHPLQHALIFIYCFLQEKYIITGIQESFEERKLYGCSTMTYRDVRCTLHFIMFLLPNSRNFESIFLQKPILLTQRRVFEFQLKGLTKDKKILPKSEWHSIVYFTYMTLMHRYQIPLTIYKDRLDNEYSIYNNLAIENFKLCKIC